MVDFCKPGNIQILSDLRRGLLLSQSNLSVIRSHHFVRQISSVMYGKGRSNHLCLWRSHTLGCKWSLNVYVCSHGCMPTVYWESFANLANHPCFTKLKPSKLIFTISKLLGDLLIYQTFFRQMLERSHFAKLFSTKPPCYMVYDWICKSYSIAYKNWNPI